LPRKLVVSRRPHGLAAPAGRDDPHGRRDPSSATPPMAAVAAEARGEGGGRAAADSLRAREPRKILLVALKPPANPSPAVTYLELTAAELLSESRLLFALPAGPLLPGQGDVHTRRRLRPLRAGRTRRRRGDSLQWSVSSPEAEHEEERSNPSTGGTPPAGSFEC
jgi:hypothetical protein